MRIMKGDNALKPTGTSLASKIIFAMTLVVAISCSIFIVVSVFLVGGNIEDEINKRGISITRQLASVDIDVWKYLKNPDIVNSMINDLKSDLNNQINEIRTRDKSSCKIGCREELIQKLNEKFKIVDDVEYNGNKYKNPLQKFAKQDPSILYIDIVRIEPEGACQTGSPKLPPVIWYNSQGDKSIRFEGFYTRREEEYGVGYTDYPIGGKRISARYFAYCIKDVIKGDTTLGQARLVMDTTVFDKAKIRVVRILLIPLLIALGTSILIGGLMATRIVSPIKELIADIDEISSGNLDHRATIKSSDEIGMIGVSFNRMTKSLKSYMEEVINRAVMAQEYDSATTLINEYLLRIKEKPKVPNLDVSIIYYPSKDVSGDYYDYDFIDNNKLYVLVSDVSGKGLPASLISTVFKNLLMYDLERTRDPKETLININRALRKSLKKGMFITVSFLIYNIEKTVLTAYSAGHLPVLIYRPQDAKVIEVNPPGIAIGLDEKLFARKLDSVTIQLKKNDRFISYSDGIIEAQDEHNRCFGVDKLKELLVRYTNKSSSEFIHVLSKEINDFTSGAIVDNRLFDDITIFTGKVI